MLSLVSSSAGFAGSAAVAPTRSSAPAMGFGKVELMGALPASPGLVRQTQRP